MRQIILNDKYYKVTGEIIKRAINPWKASIRTAGGLEYQSFQNAELEEWHDLRNGIGLESELPAESARLWWSEGIDFSSPRSAVLSPLVTTAGTFGVAPVKIIDFGGKTYAIGNSKISEWSGSAWTPRDTSLANPTDAIVVTDSTDEYLVVCSATQALYSIDGSIWKVFLREDLSTHTELDDNTKLTVTDTKATGADVDADESVHLYKDYTADYFDALYVEFELYIASTSEVNGIGGVGLTETQRNDISAFGATEISCTARKTEAAVYKIYLARGPDTATDFYTCSADTPYYCLMERVAGNDTVTVKIYSDAGRTTLLDTLTLAGISTTKYRYLYGFVNWNTATGDENFDGYVQNLSIVRMGSYLADYDNRLYSITTNGKTVSYSTAKDIDAYSGYFDLTGKFGTVYDLFEGKLLADGTPTLYFCGTEGLFTINTTTEKAYKQEVAYPPLTYAGHRGLYWNANVWVAAGYGILKVAPSMASFVGPDQDDGLPSTYQGKIYDMVTVNNWLVFCVNSGASGYSSILKRNSSLGGNLQVYTGANNAAIACLCHTPSSATYPEGRLWFGEGTSVKYMMFPDTTSNVKQVATYEYVDDSGYGKLPILRKLAAISKTALGMAAITKSCTEVDTHDETIEVYYGLNGAAPTTHLGDFTTSPKPTLLTFPPPVGEVPSTGLGTEFYTIQFAIKLTRGTTNTWSPELESLMFYYLPTPVCINGWIFVVECTDEDAEARIAEFEALKATNTLVVFNPTGDPNKTDFNYNVKLTQMPMRFYVEEQGTRETKGIEVVVEEVFKG